MTLHDRIRAVVEERLRLAREAAAASYGSWAEDSSFFADLLDPLPSQKREHPGYIPMITREDVRHIAANDPADAILSAEHALSVLERHAIVHRSIHIFDDLDTYEELPVCGRCVPKHSTFRTLAEVPAACEPLLALATRWRVEVDR